MLLRNRVGPFGVIGRTRLCGRGIWEKAASTASTEPGASSSGRRHQRARYQTPLALLLALPLALTLACTANVEAANCCNCCMHRSMGTRTLTAVRRPALEPLRGEEKPLILVSGQCSPRIKIPGHVTPLNIRYAGVSRKPRQADMAVLVLRIGPRSTPTMSEGRALAGLGSRGPYATLVPSGSSRLGAGSSGRVHHQTTTVCFPDLSISQHHPSNPPCFLPKNPRRSDPRLSPPSNPTSQTYTTSSSCTYYSLAELGQQLTAHQGGSSRNHGQRLHADCSVESRHARRHHPQSHR